MEIIKTDLSRSFFLLITLLFNVRFFNMFYNHFVTMAQIQLIYNHNLTWEIQVKLKSNQNEEAY